MNLLINHKERLELKVPHVPNFRGQCHVTISNLVITNYANFSSQRKGGWRPISEVVKLLRSLGCSAPSMFFSIKFYPNPVRMLFK